MLEPYGLDMEVVETKFRQLQSPVQIILFTRESRCLHCHAAERLYERIAAVTHKVEFETYNFAINMEQDAKYGVFAAPAVAIIGASDYGIRYYCYPQGLELYNFLDDIVLISTGIHHLSEEVLEKIGTIKVPINLKVFISSGCPYSLPIARLAMKLAIASAPLTVAIIDASEFVDIADQYKLKGVPMTIVNEQLGFYGGFEALDYVEQVIALHNEEEIDHILRYI